MALPCSDIYIGVVCIGPTALHYRLTALVNALFNVMDMKVIALPRFDDWVIHCPLLGRRAIRSHFLSHGRQTLFYPVLCAP
jgi:hypothetical protein